MASNDQNMCVPKYSVSNASFQDNIVSEKDVDYQIYVS